MGRGHNTDPWTHPRHKTQNVNNFNLFVKNNPYFMYSMIISAITYTISLTVHFDLFLPEGDLGVVFCVPGFEVAVEVAGTEYVD